MTKYLLSLAALFFSVAANAKENCSDIVLLSRVTSQTSASSDEVQSNAQNFCSAYQRYISNQSGTSFGASYKFLAASFGNSAASVDDVASRYCSASDNYAAKKDAYTSYIETIAPGAFDAYKSCLAVGSDLDFKLGGFSATEFTMNVTFKKPGLSSTILAAKPSQDVNCRWDEIDFSAENRLVIQSNSPETHILECRRNTPTKSAFVTIVRRDGEQAVTIPWEAFPIDGASSSTVLSLSNRLATVESLLSRKLSESGSIGLRAVGTRPIDDGSQCPANNDANRGEQNGRITFAKPFSKAPNVTIGISEINTNNGEIGRLRVRVLSVDDKGFTYEFYTWCDTSIVSATANWVAVSH